MAAKIVHFEIMGADSEAQKEFYGSIFGWEFMSMDDFPGYHMVNTDQVGMGGAVGKGPENMPNYVTVYLEVDNITDELAKVEAAGGKTVMPRTVIPDMVTLGMFTDPAGNLVGLVEAAHPEAE